MVVGLQPHDVQRGPGWIGSAGADNRAADGVGAGTRHLDDDRRRVIGGPSGHRCGNACRVVPLFQLAAGRRPRPAVTVWSRAQTILARRETEDAEVSAIVRTGSRPAPGDPVASRADLDLRHRFAELVEHAALYRERAGEGNDDALFYFSWLQGEGWP